MLGYIRAKNLIGVTLLVIIVISLMFINIMALAISSGTNPDQADLGELYNPGTIMGNIVSSLLSGVPSEKTPASPEAEKHKEKDKFNKFLYYLMSTLILCAKPGVAGLFLTVLIMILVSGKKDREDHTLSRGDRCRPLFLWCGLRFLTLRDKYLRFLVKMYDSNPIFITGGQYMPVLKARIRSITERMRVFFMYRKYDKGVTI